MSERDIKKRECACGCGRVGRFQKYASPACKQRAYRNRKKKYSLTKIETISSWLTEMFGHDEVLPIFGHLNEVKGLGNVQHVTAAVEHLVYLSQSAIRQSTKKRGLIK